MPAVLLCSTSFSILLTSGEGDRTTDKLKRSKLLAGLGATVGGAIIVVFITLKHKFLVTTDLVPLEINIKTIGHSMLSSDKFGYLLPLRGSQYPVAGVYRRWVGDCSKR